MTAKRIRFGLSSEAAQTIKARYGLTSAFEYLVGEKLMNFANAASRHPDFAQELPRFVSEVRHMFTPYEIGAHLEQIERAQSALDEWPQLLFVLRGVDENELLAIAGQDVALGKAAPAAAKMLDDSDVAALFAGDGRDCKFCYSDPHYSQATPTVQALESKQGTSRSEDPGGKGKQVTGRDADQIRTQMGSSSPCPEKARTASTSTFRMTVP
jgi:hypothetical protein